MGINNDIEVKYGHSYIIRLGLMSTFCIVIVSQIYLIVLIIIKFGISISLFTV